MALQKGDVVKITKDRSRDKEDKKRRMELVEENGFKYGQVKTIAHVQKRGGGSIAWFEEPSDKGETHFGLYTTSLTRTDEMPTLPELEEFKKPKFGKKSKLKIKDSNSIVGQDDVKKQLSVAIEKNIPALIVGETGTGKTSIVRELAKRDKREYSRFSITGETSLDDFVGKWGLKDGNTVWVDGILAEQMQRAVYFVVDEINVALPEVLAVLQSLLDDDRFIVQSARDNRIIKPHKDFRLFATMNPVDEYAGTKELNKALKSRFGMTINMQYVSPSIEKHIVSEKSGVSMEIATKIVDFAVVARKAKKDGKLFFTCSTRDLIQWGKLVDDLGTQTAFELTVLNKGNGDSPLLEAMYKDVFGKYEKLERAGFKPSIEKFEQYAKDLLEREEKMKLHYERKERNLEKQKAKIKG